MKGFGAPSGDGERERAVGEDGDAGDSISISERAPAGGDAGMLAFGGAWNGKSVGDMYRRFEGPAPVSISSIMGVIGGGGVMGVSSNPEGRRGDEGLGMPLGFGRRERCDRRDGVGDEAPGVLPGVTLPSGRGRPPTSSSMLPRSLPYAGGGARVPTLGANPHFFTFASMKTNPACPKLTCTLHGPSAPILGKRFHLLRPMNASSIFRPFRVKKTVPDRGL